MRYPHVESRRSDIDSARLHLHELLRHHHAVVGAHHEQLIEQVFVVFQHMLGNEDACVARRQALDDGENLVQAVGRTGQRHSATAFEQGLRRLRWHRQHRQ